MFIKYLFPAKVIVFIILLYFRRYITYKKYIILNFYIKAKLYFYYKIRQIGRNGVTF